MVNKIINIIGTDDFLIDFTKNKCLKKHKNIEKIELDAITTNNTKFIEAFSNSLFSTEKIIVIDNSNKLQTEQINIVKSHLLKQYYIIFIKKIPKALSENIDQNDLTIINCPKMKFPSEKIEFIKKAFPKILPSAIKKIIDINYSSLADAYALSNQIVNDYNDKKFIDESIVKIYTESKTGTTVYKIVDALVVGKTQLTMKYYDELLLADIDKSKSINLLLNILESKLSAIGKTIASKNPAKEFGYAPWQVQQIQRILYKWDSEKLKKSISFVINADYKIKSGKTKAPKFTLQKCLLQILNLLN